ncbi:MAG: TonB-dependent receptor [Rhodanobacter sp.]|nr:TonB-dependent receptor [Rhodanobacter sp.]
MRGKFKASVALLPLMATYWPALALAQTNPSTGQSSDAAVKNLDAVVVTAQKRSERLIDTPVAVTTVSSDELLTQNQTSIRDYFAQVPGLSYQGQSGLQMLTIRGVTTGVGNNPTVGVTIDDVPFGSSTASTYGDRRVPDLDPSEIERIEVLRGPQGTLYGASSMGGLLKYVTQTPELNEWHVNAQAGFVDTPEGGTGPNVRATLNAPIATDVAALQVGGFYRKDPGFVDNYRTGATNTNDADAKGGHATLYLSLGRVQAKFMALAQNLDGFDAPYVFLKPDRTPVTKDLQFDGGLTRTPYLTRTQLYSAKFDVDLDYAHLVSVSGFGYGKYSTLQDTSDTFSNVLPYFGFPDGSRSHLLNRFATDKFSQEVRLEHQEGVGIDWLLGGFYTTERTRSAQILDALQPTDGSEIGNALTSLDLTKYKESAGFGSVTYNVSPKFNIQTGVRFSDIQQSSHTDQSGPMNGGTSSSAQRSNDTVTTWMVSSSYHLTPDMMLYGRVATGYRPGGANDPIQGAPATYAPDKTTNYEFGFKGVALNRVLTFDAALFWIDWSRVQILEIDPATQFTYKTNAAAARSRGAEAALELHPSPGLKVAASIAYTDAVLTQGLPAASNAYAPAGTRLPYTPQWAGSLSADQNFVLDTTKDFFVGASLSYQGGRAQEFSPTATVPRVIAPSYTTLDLRAGINFDRFSVTAFMRNVTDRRGWTNANYRVATDPASGYRVSVITPRTVGVTFGYRM